MLTLAFLSCCIPLVPGIRQADAGAGCELQRFEDMPGLAFAPSVVLDRDLALVVEWLGTGQVIQALERDDGGTPDVPEDDLWTSTDLFSPPFRFTGNCALWRDVILASGPGEEEGEGEVFVLQRRPGGWVELDHLRPPAPGWRDGFGHALAIRGGTLLIGSPTDSFGAQYSGSAGFYERDDKDTRDPQDDEWVETQRIGALFPVERGGFGGEVVLHRDLAAVVGLAGTYLSSGVVQLYARVPGAIGEPLDDRWVLVARFFSPFGFGDGFGAHVALSREFLFISALGGETDPAVYAFARREQGVPGDLGDDTWVRLPALMGPALQPDDWRGGVLALSGGRLLVGWPQSDAAGDDSGEVLLYRRVDAGLRGDPTDDVWEPQSSLLPAGNDPYRYFGESLALDGNTALATSQGRLHVFSGKCTFADVWSSGGRQILESRQGGR